MSTRCHIVILDNHDPEASLENPSVIIYKHSDGYPDGGGVLATLAPFMKRFTESRGWDSCYLPAQLLYAFIKDSREGMRRMYERMVERDPEDTYYQKQLAAVDDDFLGYGISSQYHGDIEFAYVIQQGKVDVYECGWDAAPCAWKRLTTDRQAERLYKGIIPRKWKGDNS